MRSAKTTSQPQGSSFLSRLMSWFSIGANPAQRREHLRVPTPALDVTCQSGHDRLKGVLADVSRGGVRLLTSRPVKVNQRLTVRLEGTHCEYTTVQARVVRCRPLAGKFETGVIFVDDAQVLSRSWVAHTLSQVGLGSSRHDRRTHRRVSSCIRGAVSGSADQTSSDATVIDISQGGALLYTPRVVDPNVYMTLYCEMPDGETAISLETRVLRVDTVGDDLYAVSVRFVATSAAQQRSLSHLMAQADAKAA